MKKLTHAAVFALALLTLAGCGKIKNPFAKKETAEPTPTATTTAPEAAPPAPAPAVAEEKSEAAPVAAWDAANPAPEPKTAAAPAAAVDKNAQVIVLCYHRMEGKAGGPYSIEPSLFESHLQELKDKGIAVISMADFLAWRRGEKSIPAKSALITIDDGYTCGLSAAAPILKKFNAPATFFVYLDFVNKGGKSMSWAQLAELRDQGFEIGSHTVMHQNLKAKKPAKAKFDSQEAWLEDEIIRSKQVIEEELGIRVTSLAYPFGNHDPKVREIVQKAGYDVAFTTYGQRVGHDASPFTIGRYDVTAKGPGGQDGFHMAVGFQGPAAASGPAVTQEAGALMVTEPMNGEIINQAKPTLKANLAGFAGLEPGSVEVRVSGFGLVPAQFDPGSKILSYTFEQPLRPGPVTVIVAGKARGQKVETRWSFKYDPNAQASDSSTAELPPRR